MCTLLHGNRMDITNKMVNSFICFVRISEQNSIGHVITQLEYCSVCLFLTVFRALGIPTRCVTSFKAAHDGDYSSAMDAHWTLDGKPRKSLDDAVWYVSTVLQCIV